MDHCQKQLPDCTKLESWKSVDVEVVAQSVTNGHVDLL